MKNKRPPRITLLVDKLVQDHDAQIIGGVGEPGYTPPSASKHDEFHSAILVNWNRVDDANAKTKALEMAGYMCHYADEWTDIEGKAYRTQPDSYSWQPQYIVGDGELILKRRIRTDKDMADAYIESIMNDPHQCDVVGVDAYLWQMGFRKVKPDMEAGFDRTGNPKNVFGDMKAIGCGDLVFQMNSTHQFSTNYSVWERKPGWEDGHKDRTPVDVLFGDMRCDGTGYPPEVFALMPKSGVRKSGCNTFCDSYSHIGQHTEASIDILNGDNEKNFSVIRSENYGQYRELLEEMVCQGYAVTVKDQEDIYS